MTKYRIINVSAIEDGYPKEEYASELFDTYDEALHCMWMPMRTDATLGYTDKYEVEEIIA